MPEDCAGHQTSAFKYIKEKRKAPGLKGEGWGKRRGGRFTK